MPKLTRTLVNSLKPREADYHVWDSELERFGVKVTPTGRKVYLIRYRLNGRNCKHTIARAADMPPEKARELARDKFAMIAKGVDPNRQRADSANAKTLGELRDTYMEEHANVRKKPDSAAGDAGLWRKHIIPHFGADRRITDITRGDVSKLHARIKAAGHPYAANRMLALLSKAFNLAIEWEWLPAGSNPCKGIKKFPEKRRERPVRLEELTAMGKALLKLEGERPDLWRGLNLIWLWLLTGARMNEIQRARWDWVDWDRRLLVLPDSKGGQKLINLPEPALERLRRLPSRDRSEFLFPGNKPKRPMVNARKTVAKVWQEAKLADLRIHDLRHVFGSVAGLTGAHIRIIADLLGHAQLSTTERYLHGVGSEAQRVASATAAKIHEAMTSGVSDDVAAGE